MVRVSFTPQCRNVKSPGLDTHPLKKLYERLLQTRTEAAPKSPGVQPAHTNHIIGVDLQKLSSSVHESTSNFNINLGGQIPESIHTVSTINEEECRRSSRFAQVIGLF
jgi:hypothetical protein